MSAWVIVPVRSLSSGKSRLAGVISEQERRALNVMLLEGVLHAVAQCFGGLARCIVASADPEALLLASGLGATSLLDGPEPGLNAALETARREARSRQASSVLVIAADLPAASSGALSRLCQGTPQGCASVVADKQGRGTNALLLPGECNARFRFGDASLAAHCDAIRAIGVPVRVWNDPELAFDIDSPADYRQWIRSRDQRMAGTLPGDVAQPTR